MTREQLVKQIKSKQSFLCVGLDTDIEKIPAHLKNSEDPLFDFNKQIIDSTHDLCIAYKPNSAFYEAHGVKGWISLQKTIEYLNKNYPDHFTIADAKRGDIGNTSAMYAKAFLKDLDFDSITVAPYMGEDSVTPFLQYPDKWVILLALTSNKGAIDFQFLPTDLGPTELIYQKVLEHSSKWGSEDNLMYVVGATRGELFKSVREKVPNHFLLVPGVGAQGGSLEEVCKYGMNKDCGLIVNASRSILYASTGTDFAEKAREEAMSLQREMAEMLKQFMN